MREKTNLHVTISMMHYEFYNNVEKVEQDLNEMKNELHCIVSASESGNFFCCFW